MNDIRPVSERCPLLEGLAKQAKKALVGEVAVSFSLTRELRANMMGMTRQGVHRVLKNIQTRGLIEFAYWRMTITDPARLQQHIDGLE